jgi:hypothetical protein
MLSVNISKFNAIYLESTLNYTLYSQKLEKTVAGIARYAINALMKRQRKKICLKIRLLNSTSPNVFLAYLQTPFGFKVRININWMKITFIFY